MASLPIFEVAGSALHAQSTRLNTIASNLANIDNVSGDPQAVYKPIDPVFSAYPVAGESGLQGVRVAEIVTSEAEPVRRYEPGHPDADPEGYVYAPDMDPIAMTVNMISASRNYQNSVEVLNTAKELALATLNMNR
jgi:flagellar basal-body rod protein FlgC